MVGVPVGATVEAGAVATVGAASGAIVDVGSPPHAVKRNNGAVANTAINKS